MEADQSRPAPRLVGSVVVLTCLADTMRLDKLTIKAREAIQAAHELAGSRGHQELTPEHLLLALLDQQDGVTGALLRKMGVDPAQVRQAAQTALDAQPQVRGSTADIYAGRRLEALFEDAGKQSKEFKDEYISSEHLLLALLAKDHGAASRALKDAGVRRETLMKALAEVRGTQRVTDPEAEGKYQSLAKYTRDLTELARNGKLDPVIGRDEEIRRAMQVLSRRTKNNPVLIGDPGVGKTAIVEGIALRIADRRRPRVAARQEDSVARSRHAHRRNEVPRRVRGSPEGRPQGDRSGRRQRHPVHRRAAHAGRRGRRRGGGRRRQHAQAGAGARRSALHRRHHARRVPEVHREGQGARAPLPAGLRRRAVAGGHRRHPARAQGALRGSPRHPDS